MLVVILGITLLLAKLFPIGAQLSGLLLGGMYGPFFGKAAPVWFHVAMLVANYIPAAVAAVIFVRMTQLKSRLPKKIPGKTPILAGFVLIVLYLIPRLFASTIPGGGASFVVASFGPLFIIPADILIVVGVTKVLLAALPRVATESRKSAVQAD